MQKVKKYSKRILSVVLALVLTLAYVPLLDIETEAAATGYQWRVTVQVSKGKDFNDGNCYLRLHYYTNNGTGSSSYITISSGNGSSTPWSANASYYYRSSTTIGAGEGTELSESESLPAYAFPYMIEGYTHGDGGTFQTTVSTFYLKLEVFDQNGNLITDSDWSSEFSGSKSWGGELSLTGYDTITDTTKFPYVTSYSVSGWESSDTVYVPESGSVSYDLAISATDQYGVEWVNAPTVTAHQALINDATAAGQSATTKTPKITYTDKVPGYDVTDGAILQIAYTDANSGADPVFYPSKKVYVTRNLMFDNLFDYVAYRREGSLKTTNANAGAVSDVTSNGFTITCNSDYSEAVTVFGAQFSVTGGATYGVTADITKSSGAISEIYFDWFDSSGAHISYSNVRDKASGTVTAPSNATSAKIRFDCDIPVGSTGTVKYENVRVYQYNGVQENITVPTPGITAAMNKTFGSYTAPVPTRPGYTFNGWYINIGGTEYYSYDASGKWVTATFGSDVPIAGYTTTYRNDLYSKWTAKQYNILFDTDLDMSMWNKPTSSNGTVSNITSDGFTLTSNADAGEATVSSPYFATTPGEQYYIDIDIIGDNWDVYVFFCDESGAWVDFQDSKNRFSSNGGGVASRTFTAPEGSVKAQIRVDANNGNNTVTFDNIRVVNKSNSVEDVDMGDNASYKTVTYDASYGTAPVPTRPGYSFAGWYDENGTCYYDANGNAALSEGVKITSTLKLHSQWTPRTYEVNFNSNGGSTVNTINFTPDDTLTLPTPTRTGYTFKGWEVVSAWGGTNDAENTVINAKIGTTFAPGFSQSGIYGCYSLKAVWEPTTYTITFDSDGGSSVSVIEYNIEQTVVLPSTTKTGYTFAGWEVSKTTGNWSGTYNAGNVSSMYGNVSVKAKWTPIPYAITFVDWDGKVLQQTDVDYDSAPTPPADPTRAADNGYTYAFKGWNPNVGNVTGAATYTATYTATLIPYTITLDAGEGSVSTTTVGYNYESTAVTLPDAQRTGYTFTGWTVKESVGSWTAGETANGTLSNAYGNVTLVANYEANEYNVTYDANNGAIEDGYGASFDVTYDGIVGTLLSGDEVKRTGYTFAGWNTKADGTGDTVETGDLWQYTDITTVYAQWDAIEYTITFITRDMTNNVANFVTAPDAITYTIEDDLSAILPNTTVEGYDFNYWLVPTTANVSSTSWKKNTTYATADLTTGNYGNVQLHMIYTAKSYTITWENYDGTVLETDTSYYGSTPSYDGATPTKEPTAQYSYTFSGWSPAVSTVTGNQTYTATFTESAREYTIKFVDWNGDVISEQSLKYNETPVTPADPTRESTAEFTYTFAGWTPAVGVVTDDVTYTADYTAVTRSYTITWIVDGESFTTTVKYGDTPVYNNGVDPTKAPTAEYTYTFVNWSPAIAEVTGPATYEAQFKADKNSYTVTFVNYDGTVLDTQTLDYGETPVYAGDTPTKAADVQYTYTFAGWTPEVVAVTGTATYKATYTQSVNKYTITFVDEDGTTVLDEQTLDYGEIPVYGGETPTKAATAEWTYTFAGWLPAISSVTGDATYTADYTATKNSYTITFVDENGTELQSSEVEYGTVPTAPADPTKTGDVQYSYTFAGWTPEVVAVTGTATYKATYTQSVNKYTITFVNYDDSVIQSTEVAYGSVPAVPETNPTRDADAQYTYTFNGWDNTVVAVTGDATYKATYSTKVNQYTIKFVDHDNTVLATYTLDYGTMPTAPADPTREATAEFTYTFAGWTPVIESVTGDATYTADYTAVRRSYTVTFVDDNGDVLDTQTVEYGKTPVLPANPIKAATAQYTYTFAGWSPAVEAVTGAATYTATYTETVNKYTITFYDENGTTILDTQTLDYGSSLEYNGTTPEKEPVAGVEYAFSGWSATQNGTDVIALPNVTGNASYYAVYIATNIELDVTIIEEDGTSTTTKVQYGTFASELTFDNNQTKAQDAQYTYSFIGWNVIADSETALDLATYKITANTTFYPAYSKTVREYTITFYDENGTSVLETKTVPYGTVPTATAPTKAATAQYTYTFAGWTPEVVAVTGDATYTATYTATVNKYTITFVNDDDSTLKTVTLEYGATPEAPTATKAATAQYTYTFAGWSPAVETVKDDVIYKATYTETVNKYTVKFVDEDGTELQSSEVAYGNTPVYTGATPTKTGDAQYSYAFADWSPAISSVTGVVTYTATYTQSVNEYTIKFVNEDGTVLQSSDWKYGDTPVYTGATPTKAADAQYTYTFAAWDNEIASVTGDATYTATYSRTVNKYVITFKNEDGTVLQSSEWDYGSTPVYTGATPTKTADAQYTYTFADWDNPIVAVTGEATYTAAYDKTVNKYTINFVNEDGTVLQSTQVEYGTVPTYDGATPTKAADAQYTYTFAAWYTTPVAVTGEATYTATYSNTVNKYTITFENEDGTVLQSTEVEYGSVPTYDGATPTKDATAQYTYTHSGWTPEVVAVTGTATYTATYSKTVNEYTITWVTGTDTYTGTWAYGSTPDPVADNVDTSKASTVSTDYAFTSWDVEIVTVTGDATYTAQYAETTRKYTITWVIDGVSTTEDVEYGTVPTAPANPTKASTAQYEYTFASWDNEVVAVAGAATYTAIFTETVRKYTITWVTGSGEYTGSWEYGSTPDPVVDNVDTSKAPTAEASYSFAGWDKTISTVTGAVTYTAKYDEKVREYTVTYVVDGVTLEEQTVAFGSNFNHPAIPAKEGYSSHWDVSFMTMPAQDITVIAVYTAKKYTVTWVADDNTVYEELVAFGSAIPSKNVPEKVGHTGVWLDIPATMPAGDVTITAEYTANTYSVTWTFTYGSGSDLATYGDDYAVIFDVVVLPVDVRITVGGNVLEAEYYSYNPETGELFITGTAIIGNIAISEKAAEGYQNVVISAVNATLTNTTTIIAEGTAFHTQIVPEAGFLVPETVTVCIDGIELYEGYTYDANTGRLTINAEVMYGELSIRFECPVNPNYSGGNVSDKCNCNCHSSSAFVRFFFSIANFFRKIFGMTQYRYCDCGTAHW